MICNHFCSAASAFSFVFIIRPHPLCASLPLVGREWGGACEPNLVHDRATLTGSHDWRNALRLLRPTCLVELIVIRYERGMVPKHVARMSKATSGFC